MQLDALSLFSGIGGFCEGARLAGVSVVGAAELDKYAAANYRLNFPSTPLFEGDVRQLFSGGSAERVQQLNEFTRRGVVDLVFGGPPCQGYSQIVTVQGVSQARIRLPFCLDPETCRLGR